MKSMDMFEVHGTNSRNAMDTSCFQPFPTIPPFPPRPLRFPGSVRISSQMKNVKNLFTRDKKTCKPLWLAGSGFFETNWKSLQSIEEIQTNEQFVLKILEILRLRILLYGLGVESQRSPYWVVWMVVDYPNALDANCTQSLLHVCF